MKNILLILIVLVALSSCVPEYRGTFHIERTYLDNSVDTIIVTTTQAAGFFFLDAGCLKRSSHGRMSYNCGVKTFRIIHKHGKWIDN